MENKERKTRRIIERLFKDFSGTVMSRQEAIDKIGEKPFQNFTGPMRNYGFVEYERDEGLGRKILTLRLTDKGREVLTEGVRPSGTTTRDPLTDLNALGAFIERFNGHNRYWELKLMPKEKEPMKQ